MDQNPYDDVNKTGFLSRRWNQGKDGPWSQIFQSQFVKQPNMLRKVQMVIVPDMGGNNDCGCHALN
jgi:hypothetical protein